MIITIDGPAGSGKSTAARELAGSLHIAYLDTGAMYRAVTLAALRSHADLHDGEALATIARTMSLQMQGHGHALSVTLDGRDVSAEIRLGEVSENAHYVARAPAVRAVLVQMQRQIGRQLEQQSGGVVTEGRDQGSVVFPHAQFKFYLDASAQVRAQRRYDELKAAGQPADLAGILESIVLRDGRDRSRSVAPLVRPDGAVEIDTSRLSIEQVIERMRSHVEQTK